MTEPASPRGTVVLCLPMAEERVGALRGFRLLAKRLTDAGFRTLRFDPLATGDSDGEGGSARWSDWLEDVRLAVAHVHGDDALPLAFVGARLGGAIAANAAEKMGGVDALVMWEPVTEGRDHIERKRAEHRRAVEDEVAERPGAAAFAGEHELFGYRFSPALLDDLSKVNLGAIRGTVAERVLTVRSGSDPDEGPWYETFMRRAGRQERVVVPEPAPWHTEVGFDAAPVPTRSIAAMVDWLEEVFA